MIKEIEKIRANSVSGVFETSEENMQTLKTLFEENHEIFCPTEDTTFEEFCGYMLVAGTNFMQREFINFAMRKMLDGLKKD